MKFDYTLFLRALGLAIIIEGLCWTLFPGGMRRALLQLLPLPESRLRIVGLIALAVGLGLVALACRSACSFSGSFAPCFLTQAGNKISRG